MITHKMKRNVEKQYLINNFVYIIMENKNEIA